MSDRRTWKDTVRDVLSATPVALRNIYCLVGNVLGTKLTPNQQAKVRQTLQILRDEKRVRHFEGALWAGLLTQALCQCGERLPWSLDVVGVGPLDYGCPCGRQYAWTGALEERLLTDAMKPRDDQRTDQRRLLLFGMFNIVGVEPFELVASEYGYETHTIQKETVAARLGAIKADAVVVLTSHISHKLGDHGKRIARSIGAPYEEIHSVTSLRQALGSIERRLDQCHPCAGGW